MSVLSVDSSELSAVRKGLDDIRTILDRIDAPANPGMGVLGVPVLSSAYDSFSKDMGKRTAGSVRWCEETNEGLAFTIKQIGHTEDEVAGAWAKLQTSSPAGKIFITAAFSWGCVFDWNPDLY